MSIAIKPIETVYNGYRFRSRLEARWAVFFDYYGFRYEYEAEGFDLGKRGWYLPDFKITRGSAISWMEIKPETFDTEIALAKCQALAMMTNEIVALTAGNPWPDEYRIYIFSGEGKMLSRQFHYTAIDSGNCGPRLLSIDQLAWIDSKLETAFKAARQARFER